MGIESGTYLSDLNSAWPLGTDQLSTADDHLRLIKSFIQATFPSYNAAVTATPTELNQIHGQTISSGSFTGTLTGLTTSPTGTCKWLRWGNLVLLYIPSITGTSNAATLTMTGLPAGIQVANTQTMASAGVFEDAGNAFRCGSVLISVSSGTVQFGIATVSGTQVVANLNGWTSSGTKGISQGATYSYTLA